MSRNRWRKQLPLVLLLSGGLVLVAPEASSAGSYGGVRVTVVPQPSGSSAPASEAQVRQHLEWRERIDTRNNRSAAAASAAAVKAELPRLGVPEQSRGDVVSEANSIQHIFRNSVADDVRGNILAEPAAAKRGTEVLYMGNTYISRSPDSGASWAEEEIPAGPSFAPEVCCDPDVVYHPGQDTTFASFLYRNSDSTDGAVQIFIRRGTIADGNDCVAVVDPGGATTIPDYPHLGVSDNFLYLTMNNIDSNGTVTGDDDTWINSQVVRINVSDMANCVASPRFTVFTFGGSNQRVFVPVENATTTMYWGSLDSSTTFRIFRWREGDVSPSQLTRSGLDASNFNRPDCRGGTADFNWMQNSTAFSITGFRLRGAVGGGQLIFLWNVGTDESHPQGHIHVVALQESDLAVVAQPHVFSYDTCTGYPVVGANSQGNFGLSQAAGGRSGGLAGDVPCSSDATCAARGYISVDDEDSTGIFFAFRSLTADGTHNPSDGRIGDYFTVRKNEDCPLTWVATNYSLDKGNTSASNVNASYIEFGSSLDPACP